jgi:16S rRNA processing protein RimM
VTAPEYAVVGRVRRAHGIRGELVVEPFTDAPDAIFASGRRLFVGDREGEVAADGRTVTVRAARDFKEGLLVHFDGLADRNEAEKWRERTFLVPLDELPPPADDEVYFHDLIGMRAELASGAPVGEVVALYELPQGVVLEVKREKGDTVLVPYSPQAVTEVDMDARVVRLDPPEGLLE